ncbi:MAG TPA: DUF2120 domain-containing protein [Methanococcaceae archaeon]|uniref:DUF2120 domain-containing protein n=1 Tax=Methanothermococcus okinawensis TaxID=155863 RepID=A0A832ZR43_9EURY|nr:DUF2120 domain-containing protein [Methanococcaceae archaeon]HIP90953.1 DUF2120 domain-containing protein [Methanothermococcus okinawensis]
MIIRAITGRIIHSLGAFKGSRPLYDSNDLLIVRGICRDRDFEKYNSIREYLEEKLKENGFEIVDNREDIEGFVERIDRILRGEDNSLYPDAFGFEKLKNSFEEMGCVCDYVIGRRGDITVGISMWYDRMKREPRFVEVVCCQG